MQTRNIDALFLELAQFVSTRTPREVSLEKQLESLSAENATLRQQLADEYEHRANSGGHFYPGCEGGIEDFFTSDCEHGCGCWMGNARSGGPNGVAPFGDCPNNPAKICATCGQTIKPQKAKKVKAK